MDLRSPFLLSAFSAASAVHFLFDVILGLRTLRSGGTAMKLPNQLSIAEMEQIIGQIQALLWRDLTQEGDCGDLDKEWDCATLEYIAAVFEDHGLRPGEAIAEAIVVLDRETDDFP